MTRRRLPRELARRSDCPIATALDLVGDKWSLLLVRDIGLFDKHRNKDLQEAGEGIPTNILADRLRRLVETGLAEKRLYQENPPRYEYHLTQAGKGLLPVIQAMAKWSSTYVEGIKLPQGVPRTTEYTGKARTDQPRRSRRNKTERKIS